ncbi:unnamed protein product [Ceutorhynchus assimilis]|uniref:Beta-galactosidase n=1 Tax=Ceutorhynchus assimilis TaxID=467358 RepID=A0A9N9QJ08_9CUCU|nr:unnamed protein product [Ceutorhynchus assimilis]
MISYNMAKLLIFSIFFIIRTVLSEDLPTNYEHFIGDEIKSGLSADQSYFILNGKNITIFSGAFHYFRVHPNYWRDRLRKMRAAGLNTVETYVPWNLHEPENGVFDFGSGGSDFEQFLDVERFIKTAQEEDLFVLLRPGPYICAEWEFGGLPAWLLDNANIKLRQSDPIYLKFVFRYFKELFSIIAPLQFTNGGPIIAMQVENEYGNTWNHDPDYLRTLAQVFRSNGITTPLYTSDPMLSVGDQGALPGELLITANFNMNVTENLDKLHSFQVDKPTMAMEFWSGWFDHITENHTANLVPIQRYETYYEEILAYPSSVNIYMFVGGTNWGFMNGAGDVTYEMNNSGLQPSVTSYDYDGPITEQGQISEKFNATKKLLAKYNTVKTKLPEISETPAAVTFDDIKIEQQILLKDIIDSHPNKIKSNNVIPMEAIGQNFGYIVYRKTNLNLNAHAILKITGYVRDHVLVLVDGKLMNPALTSVDDLNKFGYWRLVDSAITLPNQALTNVTLDLIVENNSRTNFGILNQFNQLKGLTEDVYIDDNIIQNWELIPLDFKKSWNNALTGWHEVKNRELTPALYKVTFTVSELRDTYINVQEWQKGIVIINNFVLGRIFAVGPQQTLYLPAGLLKEGENEIIIFEHFSAPEYVKFSDKHIWGYGSSIKEL